MRKYNLSKFKTFRKNLRNNLTPAEAELWNHLKNDQLENRKFRRQHSIGNYILDFYCPREKLAIELDGQVHYEFVNIHEKDLRKEEYLNSIGIKVIHFENKEIFEDIDLVLDEIQKNFIK